MPNLNSIQSQKTEITKELILLLISCIDLTTLNHTDSEKDVLKLVEKANLGFKNTYPAAVCVFPQFGNFVKENVNKKIQVAVVSSSFPSSQTFSLVKIFEAKEINQTKVDEVDIVINRGDLLEGNSERILEEIKLIRKEIPKKHLKVILETGELLTEKLIKKAAEISIQAGADFIKTSTGKSSIGSTPEAVYWMCEAIQKHYQTTGKKIGIKPSGGIKNLNDAIEIYQIVKTLLGNDWLHPSLFRIGASSLYDNLIEEYKKRFHD